MPIQYSKEESRSAIGKAKLVFQTIKEKIELTDQYKLGDGVLLVPSDMEEEILQLLSEEGAKYKSTKIWRQPYFETLIAKKDVF